jgi:hypothetical protein
LSRKTNEQIKLPQQEIHIAELGKRIAELEVKLLPTPRNLATSRHLGSLRVGVNKYLQDKETIAARLFELGAIGCTQFGGHKPPPSRSVAISQYLSPDAIREVLDAAKGLNFDRYTLFDNRAEQTPEDVLFGAYGEAGIAIHGPSGA